jgi:hypothetical protein
VCLVWLRPRCYVPTSPPVPLACGGSDVVSIQPILASLGEPAQAPGIAPAAYDDRHPRARAPLRALPRGLPFGNGVQACYCDGATLGKVRVTHPWRWSRPSRFIGKRGKPHKAPRFTVRGALASGRGQAATVKPRRDLISRPGRSNPWGRSPARPAPPPCVPAPPPRRSAAQGDPCGLGGASGLAGRIAASAGRELSALRPVLSGSVVIS